MCIRSHITYICWVLCWAVFSFSGGFAQNVKQDILRINEAYESPKGFSASVFYKWYPTYTSQVASQEIEGAIRKKGKFYFTDYGQSELLINQHYTVVVSHQEKMVMIRPSSDELMQQGFSIDLDSALSWCSAAQFSKIRSDQYAIRLEFASGKYQAVKVFYHPQTYFIQQITFYFRDKIRSTENGQPAPPRMEIHYKDVRIDGRFKSDTFSEKRYFQKMGKTPLLHNTFAQYQLMNLL